MIRQMKFAPQGLLLLPRAAYGASFDVFEEKPQALRDGVAVVNVRGPLMHHRDWACDSYDAIKERVTKALAEHPKAIVMCLDSPGGLVSGCFDTAREIRAMCARARVPLYAFVDGQATSAAYALACAAERIFATETSVLGSIGVIDTLADVTAQDAMFGVKIKLVASGARKTDGNPHAPLTEDAELAALNRVNALADIFFRWVSEARGIAPEAVRGLEAAVLLGSQTVGMLADELCTYDSLLSRVASGEVQESGTMASKGYEDAIATLRKVAEGDDDQAKKAKRMLAAELAEDPEPKKDEEPAPKEGEGKAEGTPPEKKEGEEDAKALALKALAEVHTLKATGEKKEQERLEAEERKTLLASRPDFAPELVKILQTSPMATVREMVKDLPVAPKPKIDPKTKAAAITATGTRGEGQGSPSIPTAETAEMDLAMGVVQRSGAIQKNGSIVTFGAMSRADAAKHLEGLKQG